MTLLGLPEELILNVIDHLPGLPRPRRQALTNLSWTCRTLRRIALEALLLYPVVNPANTFPLVRAYLAQTEIGARVQSLELCQSVLPQLDLSTNAAASSLLMLDGASKQGCIAIINSTATSTKAQQDWIHDLEFDHQNAFLCILLVMLPKLTELYSGTNKLKDLGALQGLFDLDNLCDRANVGKSKNLPWKKSYLCDVLARISPQLQLLEAPMEWRQQVYLPMSMIASLGVCTSLRHLSVSDGALVAYIFYSDRNIATRPPPSNSIVPLSIHSLTINIDRGTHAWTEILKICLWRLLKRPHAFPNLQRITLIYHGTLFRILKQVYEAHDDWMVQYASDLGIEFIIIAPEHGAIVKSLHDKNSALYGSYLRNVVPTETEIITYESRGSYEELGDLRRRANMEELDRLSNIGPTFRAIQEERARKLEAEAKDEVIEDEKTLWESDVSWEEY